MRNDAQLINLTNNEYMVHILKYYELLSNGRVKPNSKGIGESGTVRESSGESDDLAQVKAKLAEIFRLDTDITYYKNKK